MSPPVWLEKITLSSLNQTHDDTWHPSLFSLIRIPLSLTTHFSLILFFIFSSFFEFFLFSSSRDTERERERERVPESVRSRERLKDP
jgi:hypothetical protein